MLIWLYLLFTESHCSQLGLSSSKSCLIQPLLSYEMLLRDLGRSQEYGRSLTHRMCSSWQGGPLDRSPSMTAIVPEYNLAWIGATNHQIWMKTGKADWHHWGLCGRKEMRRWVVSELRLLFWIETILCQASSVPPRGQKAVLIWPVKYTVGHFTHWHRTSERSASGFPPWNLKFEVLAMLSNGHKTYLKHIIVLWSMKSALWTFPISSIKLWQK